ncbi:hypothetical protein GALL_336130 [mine drainage metagenome]|uniref:Uncharacterized protein n=1 Tax=mine drainage metagenome TaxID=410659 RepID=A0A1J5QXL8_9ZZZZ
MRGNQLPHLWQALYSRYASGQSRERWELDGVIWSRQRHVYWSDVYSFRLEFHTLTNQRSKLWQLLVVKELYWGQDRQVSLKDRTWHKVQTGNVADVLEWLVANLPEEQGQ